MPKLPVGQHEVKNWPVLDLGDVARRLARRVAARGRRARREPVHADVGRVPGAAAGRRRQRLPLRDDVEPVRQPLARRALHDDRRAGRAERARRAFVLCTGYDFAPGTYIPYTTNLPLERAIEDDVLLVHTWEGQPLPREHGGPCRMITPKLYAWKGTKWIRRIEFLADDRRGFWEVRGYSDYGGAVGRTTGTRQALDRGGAARLLRRHGHGLASVLGTFVTRRIYDRDHLRVAARSDGLPHPQSGPANRYPLGATWTGLGVNFAIFSEHATRVELCLFDSPDATAESERIPLPEQTTMVWHGYLPDSGRASSTGTASTARTIRHTGHRFNPQQDRHRSVREGDRAPGPWDDAMFGYTIGHPQADLSFDARDSAPFAPLAAVVDPAFTWGDDRPPRTPWHKTVIYEMHVAGFSKLHPRHSRSAARHLRGAHDRAGASSICRSSASRPSS